MAACAYFKITPSTSACCNSLINTTTTTTTITTETLAATQQHKQAHTTPSPPLQQTRAREIPASTIYGYQKCYGMVLFKALLLTCLQERKAPPTQ